MTYKPELIEAITKKLTIRKDLPEGWMTNKSLADQLKVSFPTVKTAAERLVQKHPEWIDDKNYKDGRGKATTAYSLELVEAITKELAGLTSRKNLPEGWMTNKNLANQLKIGDRTLKKIAERLAKDHPEWINNKDYKDVGGHAATTYSLELVKAVKKDLDKA
jgi:Mn-dependent DtxR family transcriptional regulator